MDLTLTSKNKWPLVKKVCSLSSPLAIFSMLFSILALLGYLTHIEFLYRPIEYGSATHPATALSILFIGCSILLKNLSYPALAQVFTMLGIIFPLGRLIDASLTIEIFPLITPFHEQVKLDQAMGKPNAMGVNSAILLATCCIALFLESLNRHLSSQSVIFIGLSLPMVSITGYAYGIDHFYGQMSILTMITGFALTLAILAMTADQGGLKAILSPYTAGKAARFQVLAGYFVPFFLGLLFITVSPDAGSESIFGIFVVVICWFFLLMVAFTVIRYEAVDHRRRDAEAALYNAALTDQLTTLPNRRYFMDAANRELMRAKRTKVMTVLLIMDVDFFKKINDTAGHAMGDEVLKTIAQVLQGSIRETDLVCRYGGEEFAILLTNTSSKGAQRVSETLRSNIETMTVAGWTDVHGQVTVSIGVAQIQESYSLDQSLDFADKALYHAKNSGRNQVSFYHDKDKIDRSF